MIVLRERILARDPRLGRHIHHDSRSWGYAYPTAGIAIRTVRHPRHVPVFDQGNLGSCVPNAGLGCLATGSLYGTQRANARYPLTEAGALDLYRAVTRADPYPGAWEPDDTGSDGLTCAKVLTAAGQVAGYLHTFTLGDALRALQDVPLITGTYWLSAMFNPSPEGLVVPTGAIEGGHEYVVDEYDDVRGWVGFTNSWSADWGVDGRFYMEAEKYAALLEMDGDVTAFAALVAPIPPPDPDRVFADVLHPWVGTRHIGGNEVAARAGRAWLHAKGL